ncbi:MAG TPA: nucleotidyltransferase family protein [Rhizomicrobium sp.]|nr:nucleotidyltransferase family protein [Rhizomicrobium sp.]
MTKPITRAMIMAAGLGTRMRPLTNDRPKPLVKVRGKALIDHAIDRLVKAGVKTIVVNIHHHAEMLRAHLANRKDVKIVISDESEALLDSGGGIAKVLDLFEGQPFFTHNSDSVWVEGASSALERMKARWNPDTMDSLMLVAPTVNARCYEGRGDFMMDAGGRLTRVPEHRVAPFVWIGVQILHPRLFDGAPLGRFSINPLWDKAMEKGRLFGIRLDGIWMHIDRPDAVTDAERFLADLPPST